MKLLESGPGPCLGWQLAWSDEFDYEGLPDPSKWDFEEGFLRNGEMQYYTRGRKENARVESGMLVIEARKESFPNPVFRPGSDHWAESRKQVRYTSASLTSRVEGGLKYGRVEVLAQLPEGKGVWPAIWMLGINKPEVSWPACGEIDILEFVGNWPGEIFGTIHYPVEGAHEKQEGKLTGIDPHDGFHLYAVEWFPERIDFFFDAQKYHTAWLDPAGRGDENPFRKPHYLILNLALGGSLGGEIDDSAFPHQYRIKSVKAYKLNNPP
jgi:beta-glucanase (GH16 family)